VSSRARLLRIRDELAVHHIGQSPFQCAQGFHGGLARRDAATEVRAALGVIADLDDGHDVQGPVDAPVTGAGETVALLLAGYPKPA